MTRHSSRACTSASALRFLVWGTSSAQLFAIRTVKVLLPAATT